MRWDLIEFLGTGLLIGILGSFLLIILLNIWFDFTGCKVPKWFNSFKHK